MARPDRPLGVRPGPRIKPSAERSQELSVGCLAVKAWTGKANPCSDWLGRPDMAWKEISVVIATMSWKEFLEEGARRFGPERENWRFQCVACGHVQSISDFMARHPQAIRKDVASWIFTSCEGRVDKSVGCNWSLGGLLHIQERMIVETGTEAGECPVFLFDGETANSPPFYTPRERPASKEHPHDKRR